MSPQPVDAAIHRCPDCGGWLYGRHTCTTCGVVWAMQIHDEDAS